jgi:transcriptional regulator with XRE-family HTH domain
VPKPSTRESISSSVIQALRSERIRKGLSMNAVAQRAGLHVSMISLVEREMRKPTLDALLRIAEALEIDLWRPLRKATEENRPPKATL